MHPLDMLAHLDLARRADDRARSLRESVLRRAARDAETARETPDRGTTLMDHTVHGAFRRAAPR